MLNADELLAVPAPEGKPCVTLRIRLSDRTVTAEIASKSLKAQTAIRDAGADNITLAPQGRLAAGDVIAQAASARSLRGQGGDDGVRLRLCRSVTYRPSQHQ